MYLLPLMYKLMGSDQIFRVVSDSAHSTTLFVPIGSRSWQNSRDRNVPD